MKKSSTKKIQSKTRIHSRSKKPYTTRRSAALTGGPRGELPQKLETQWTRIFDAVYDVSKNEPRSARIAWYQIEKEWKKDKTGKWTLRKSKTRSGTKKTKTKTRMNCGMY